MSFDTLAAGVPWDDFETFPQYLDAVERRGVALNYGCYVGHTAVRLYVMGERGLRAAGHRRRARRACRQVVAEAMAGGAIGFATSASPTHNGDQRPARCRRGSPTSTSSRRCSSRCATPDTGVVALLPGGVFSNDEVFDLQREVGRPFTWTALLTIKGFPYHEEVIAEHDAARADGVEVWPQVSCRPLVFQMNLAEPFTFNMRPTFAALMGRPARSAWPPTATRRGGRRRGTSCPAAQGVLPVELGLARRSPSATARPELVGRKVVDLAAEQRRARRST